MGVSAGEWMSGGGELIAGNPAIPRDLGRLELTISCWQGQLPSRQLVHAKKTGFYSYI